jgi:hypothetical protein
MKFFIPTITEKTINADEAFRIIAEYKRLVHILSTKVIRKAIITEYHTHISDTEIQSTMIVPVQYDPYQQAAYSMYYQYPTIEGKDLEKDWIKVKKGSNMHYVHIDIEQFFQLDEWTEEDVPTITSKIIAK